MTRQTETTPRDLSLDELDAIAAGETSPPPSGSVTCGFAYASLTVGGVRSGYRVTFGGSLLG